MSLVLIAKRIAHVLFAPQSSPYSPSAISLFSNISGRYRHTVPPMTALTCHPFPPRLSEPDPTVSHPTRPAFLRIPHLHTGCRHSDARQRLCDLHLAHSRDTKQIYFICRTTCTERSVMGRPARRVVRDTAPSQVTLCHKPCSRN